MNLQESIRRILRETVNESTFFRRRVDMRLLEKEFYENLNYSTDGFISKLKKGISFDFDVFKRIVMHNLMDDYHNDLSDGGLNEFPYDEIYEFLSDHFHDKIKDRYDLILSRNINESKTLQENEEKTNKNVNLVKQIIYDFFDEVTSIEVSEYDDKPKLIVHLYSNSRAANIKSWFDENISNEVMQMTGGHIVVCPYWTPDWDFRKKIVDIYIDTRVRRI